MLRIPFAFALCGGLLGVALPTASPAAIPFPEDAAANIRARVDNGYDTGMVAALATDQGSATFVYGLSAPGQPLKADAIFEIGSVTKVFTTTLLADMVAKGEVGLDDPAEKYMPAGAKVPERNGKKITLRHLASHTSGLPRMPQDFSPANADDPYADYNEAKLLASLASCQLENDPGAKYTYSNLGGGLLGYLLARRAGKPWDVLVRERVIAPLGLKDTTVVLTPEQQKRFSPGHLGGEVVPAWHLDALAGAGALRGTAGDLLRFSGANAGMLASPLLPAMKTTHEPIAATDIPNTQIALGWHVTTSAGGAVLVWHNGGTGGFRSFTGFVKGGKRVTAVLSNTSADVDALGMHLLDPKVELPRVDARKTVGIAPEKLKRLAGKYTLAPGQIMDVREEAGKLTAQLTGQPRYEVFPESETTFFYKVVEAKLAFELGPDGRAKKLTLHQNGMAIPAPLTDASLAVEPKVVAVAPEKLKRLVGRYTLAPGQILDVQEAGGKLSAQLTGQPRFEIFAESETSFFCKVVEAKLVFELGADGRAAKVTLFQGGMELPAPRVQ